jgi:hypothetical protein
MFTLVAVILIGGTDPYMVLREYLSERLCETAALRLQQAAIASYRPDTKMVWRCIENKDARVAV